jgi:hypothetical protein
VCPNAGEPSGVPADSKRLRWQTRMHCSRVIATCGRSATIALTKSCLVQTFEYEGDPTHVILETITFEGDGDGTRLTTRSVCSSVADRDAMAAAGMERGARQSMDRLASLLGSPRR